MINDNKALTNILNNPKSNPPPRIERLSLKLQGFDVEGEYVSLQNNTSDCLSRNPTNNMEVEVNALETQVNQTIHYAMPVALTIDDIKKGTVTDPVLSKVIEIIKKERWCELDTLPQEQETIELKQYRKIKDSLSLNDEPYITLKDNRIFIPRCLEIIVVKLAHIGHQGLVKTKPLLRSKVFF